MFDVHKLMTFAIENLKIKKIPTPRILNVTHYYTILNWIVWNWTLYNVTFVNRNSSKLKKNVNNSGIISTKKQISGKIIYYTLKDSNIINGGIV